MAESALNAKLMKVLRERRLDPRRVENSADPGTPDINCTLGWIESKHKGHWPPIGNLLKVPNFTPQQRFWLQRRWHANGGAWMALQVGREVLLFTGVAAAALVGKSTEKELRAAALKTWRLGINGEELERCLRQTVRST